MLLTVGVGICRALRQSLATIGIESSHPDLEEVVPVPVVSPDDDWSEYVVDRYIRLELLISSDCVDRPFGELLCGVSVVGAYPDLKDSVAVGVVLPNDDEKSVRFRQELADPRLDRSSALIRRVWPNGSI